MFDPKEKFPRLFRDGVDTVQGHEARIALTAEARPRFHRPRPVPYALQEKGQSGTRSHATRGSDANSREE